MGEFVSNVAKLLDEAQMKKFNEGIQQGMQKGKLEGRLEVARKLIQRGFSDEDIAELTELEVERIRELRKEISN